MDRWIDIALRLRGPHTRGEWPALREASREAARSLAAAGEEAGWVCLAAEVWLQANVDGERHRVTLQAARAQVGAGDLRLRLWLSEARSLVLRGDLTGAGEALQQAQLLTTADPRLDVERALIASAIARQAGDLGRAAALATDGAGAAERLSDLLLLAQAHAQRAAAAQEAGDRAAARSLGQRSLALAQLARCDRTAGLAMSNLGALCSDEGDLDGAVAWLEEALDALRAVDASRLVARTEAMLLRVRIRRGELPAWEPVEELRQRAWAVGDREVALALALEQSRLLERAGDLHRAKVREQAARWAAEAAGVSRLLPPAEDEAWAVAADGAWVQPPGAARLSLARRGAMRRVLAALSGGEVVAAHALVGAGWPGERMSPDSGLQRLYTVMKELRRLGLGDRLRTVDGGYKLDGVRVAR